MDRQLRALSTLRKTPRTIQAFNLYGRIRPTRRFHQFRITVRTLRSPLPMDLPAVSSKTMAVPGISRARVRRGALFFRQNLHTRFFPGGAAKILKISPPPAGKGFFFTWKKTSHPPRV